MDFPSGPIHGRHLGVISTLSPACKAGEGHRAVTGSAAWPAANRALFIPFRVVEPLLVRQLFWINGATVTGNVDVGVYDRTGRRLVSSGSTAQSGANVLQAVDVTDTMLGVGLFYLAVAMDSTSTLVRQAPSAQLLQSMGIVQQASAFALPATATFAAVAAGYLPIIGLTTKTVV